MSTSAALRTSSNSFNLQNIPSSTNVASRKAKNDPPQPYLFRRILIFLPRVDHVTRQSGDPAARIYSDLLLAVSYRHSVGVCVGVRAVQTHIWTPSDILLVIIDDKLSVIDARSNDCRFQTVANRSAGHEHNHSPAPTQMPRAMLQYLENIEASPLTSLLSLLPDISASTLIQR